MDISKRVEELTIELTNILSVVDTKEENNMVEKVYDFFGQMDYFKSNPENLKYVDVINDEVERKSTLATIKGKKGNSDKTVVLIGHTDTVGIDDYGDLKEYANKPLELIEKLKEVVIPDEAKADLNSGNYLFGRGIFDMKCGVATIMAIMEELVKNVENLEGNIIFAAVCDEEGNSGGMLSVVPELVKLKKSEGYEYLAIIDTDYSAPRYIGDENRYVYIGTVGKLMPSFYIVGKETHVGEPYKGLDPNEIASSITKEFNLNMDYCDVAEGEVALPPITLRQQDLKEEYSVQIAKTSYLYFNYATHISTPDEVMDKMIAGAGKAFQKTVDDLNNQYKVYCNMSNYPYNKLPWKSRIMTFEELYKRVKSEKGQELDLIIENLSKKMLKEKDIDERVFALKLVEEVHKNWSDKEPVVIAYFSPPYYPHIYVEGKENKERNLLEAVDNAIENTNTTFDIVRRKFYPYISDLSYAAAPKEDSVIKALKENMPGFGQKYKLPLKEMQELSLPVVNIGPFGKDAHKFTERVEKNYSFNVLPKIVYDTILNLLD